jgi:predicted nuclease with TOPRIM domain
MTDNRDLLFHCLEVQLKYKEIITAKTNQRDELQDDADKLRDELNNAAHCISELEKDVSSLQCERPDVYIRRKGRFVELVGYVSKKTVNYWQMTKDVVLKSWNDRRTHPQY